MAARAPRTLTLLLFLLGTCVLPATLLAAKKKPPSHPINLNTATADQLEEVPGIGPATAQKILDTRKSYGAFKSVDDLLSIKGIGQKRLDKMRKYLTVDATHTKHHTSPTPSAQTTTPPPKSPPKQSAPATPPPPASEDEEP
jgi:competence ComEA-like helix-hairpin-helix protein